MKSPISHGETLLFDFEGQGATTSQSGTVREGSGQTVQQRDRKAQFGTKRSPGAQKGIEKESAGQVGIKSASAGSEISDIAGPRLEQQNFFDIDPPKRRNAGYRVRRDLRQEQQIDMPLCITGIELRSGVAEDDRRWNKVFCELREQIVKEINVLRFVMGDRMVIELAWQHPLMWPICALRAPDGKRIIDTYSGELGRYGLRSMTLLWKGIVEKQRSLQSMARNYGALLRWSEKLSTKTV